VRDYLAPVRDRIVIVAGVAMLLFASEKERRVSALKSEFVANVSHELKTPLTSIQGFSQALADGTVQSPEEYATAARIINEESERMRRLVNDLLYLSQIESGQLARPPSAW